MTSRRVFAGMGGIGERSIWSAYERGRPSSGWSGAASAQAARCTGPPSRKAPRTRPLYAGERLSRYESAARVASVVFLYPQLARMDRSSTDTSPESMSTGQGFRHLWQMVQ